MQTVLCPPMEDVGPNNYNPNPSGIPHCQNVDEDPNDGDSTTLGTQAAGAREVWRMDLSAIPEGSIVEAVRIRSVQKRSTAGGNSYHVGLQTAGIDYFGATHSLSSGSTYLTFEDEFAVNPSDGEPWETKARLAAFLLVHAQISQAVGLPRPLLTECIVLADIVPPAPGSSATGGSAGPAGGADTGKGFASGAPAGPSAGAATGQGFATGSAIGKPRATAFSLSARSAAASRAPSGSGSVG